MLKLPTLPLLLLALTTAHAQTSEEASVAFEQGVLNAWKMIPDCAAADMCNECGLGVAVVELTNGTSSKRTYNVAPGAITEAPWGPDASVEIGSMTKPFTALAMLILQEQGVLSTGDTVGDLLPSCDWEQAVSSDVASVTLLELAEHYSGFPPMPPSLQQSAMASNNLYGDYTLENLCHDLTNLRGLPSRGRYSYSNFAYGTLGFLLQLAMNPEDPPSYDSMMKRLLFLPLQMWNTSVAVPEDAQNGCGRDAKKDTFTIRSDAYGILQGNGAIRSTLNDMAKYMTIALSIVVGPPYAGEPTDDIAKAIVKAQSTATQDKYACTCVSGWCMGVQCPLPNPNHEYITPGGMEGYTSGTHPAWRKSGDTTAFSGRIAFQPDRKRAALAIDSCGACGDASVTGGGTTVGSGSQRAALLLADGPQPVPPSGIVVTVPPEGLVFTGWAPSYQFPSRQKLIVHVTPNTDDPTTLTVTLSSSEMSQGIANATAIGGNAYLLDSNIYFGAMQPAFMIPTDPLAQVPQQRILVLKQTNDGTIAATLQDMGADMYLWALQDGDEPQQQPQASSDDDPREFDINLSTTPAPESNSNSSGGGEAQINSGAAVMRSMTSLVSSWGLLAAVWILA